MSNQVDKRLQQALSLAREGEYSRAKQTLKPIKNNEAAKAILKKITSVQASETQKKRPKNNKLQRFAILLLIVLIAVALGFLVTVATDTNDTTGRLEAVERCTELYLNNDQLWQECIDDIK